MLNYVSVSKKPHDCWVFSFRMRNGWNALLLPTKCDSKLTIYISLFFVNLLALFTTNKTRGCSHFGAVTIFPPVVPFRHHCDSVSWLRSAGLSQATVKKYQPAFPSYRVNMLAKPSPPPGHPVAKSSPPSMFLVLTSQAIQSLNHLVTMSEAAWLSVARR